MGICGILFQRDNPIDFLTTFTYFTNEICITKRVSQYNLESKTFLAILLWLKCPPQTCLWQNANREKNSSSWTQCLIYLIKTEFPQVQILPYIKFRLTLYFLTLTTSEVKWKVSCDQIIYKVCILRNHGNIVRTSSPVLDLQVELLLKKEDPSEKMGLRLLLRHQISKSCMVKKYYNLRSNDIRTKIF